MSRLTGRGDPSLSLSPATGTRGTSVGAQASCLQIPAAVNDPGMPCGLHGIDRCGSAVQLKCGGAPPLARIAWAERQKGAPQHTVASVRILPQWLTAADASTVHRKLAPKNTALPVLGSESVNEWLRSSIRASIQGS